MKRKMLLSSVAAAVVLTSTVIAVAICGDTWTALPPVFTPQLVASGFCLNRLNGDANSSNKINPTNTEKIVKTTIFWLDGFSREIFVTDSGQNRDIGTIFENCVRCFPTFFQPFFQETSGSLGTGTSYWNQNTLSATASSNGTCITNPQPHVNRYGHTCSSSVSFGCTTPGFNGGCPPGTSPDGFGFCCPTNTNTCSTAFAAKCLMYEGDYDPIFCTCSGCGGCAGSPILVDINGDGFAMTSASAGVQFDLNGDGTTPDQMAWTTASTDDAWLALDRNVDGMINNGTELFGNFTAQPPVPKAERNGFLALAEWDKSENGGNGDGKINNQDQIFTALKLWQDANHNGVSEPGELHIVSDSGLNTLDLDYKESKRVDEFGNKWKYRAKVKDAGGSQLGRWAWDVFLVQGNRFTP